MEIRHKEFTSESFKTLMAAKFEGPIQMINLLKFKDKVDDKDISGEAQYRNYMKEAYPFFKESRARIIYDGYVQLSLIGPDEKEWDKMLIIEYESKSDFISMISSEGYPAEMRKAAIENSRLILCQLK